MILKKVKDVKKYKVQKMQGTFIIDEDLKTFL